MKSQRRSYHHGDLRTSLIRAGLDMLKERSTDDLSLRELARNIGVTAPAVYRHFSDRRALLDALCLEGQAMLAEAQRAAMAAAGGGQKGFDDTGLAYVHFALAHPALFRLMIKSSPPITSLVSSGEALQVLTSNVAAVLPGNATSREQELRAVRAWSLVHGITMLILDGRLRYDKELVEAIIRAPLG